MGYFILGLCIGLGVGVAVTLIVTVVRARAADRQMRDTFAALASEALDANSRRLTEQSAATLDGKKQLIDQAVAAVNERLNQMAKYVQQAESERKAELARLSTSVTSLSGTTGELHRMLASTQRRGAWGERMAEDILRLVGMAEGVNYSKQSSADAESGRPDFTFFLPNELKVNMDVKFPLEAYKAYVDAETDEQRSAGVRQLVSDVRGHVRAVAGRGYIDPKVPTVRYVIVFLPSEHVYSLVLETAPDVLDDALRQNVVLASPMTLYAMLAVIRQAAENANITKTADEVIRLLSVFHKQYQRYSEEVDRLGKQLETVNKTYESLRTTRTNQLSKPLEKIDALRQARGLPEEAP